MPTTLTAGDIAIIGYNTDDPDTFSFVLLEDITAGTVINFTDRSWNGSAFVNSGSDSTVTFTASGAMTAGTVITSAHAGFSGTLNLDSAGDTILAYQGADATPTFLYAIDFADNNTTFAASVPTGLTLGTTAVAIALDNAYYVGQHTGIEQTQLSAVSNLNFWISNDTVRFTPQSGPSLPPDTQVWITTTGGSGGGVAHVDENSDIASNLALYFTSSNFSPSNHPTDISFDTVHGKVFVAASDGFTNQILEFDISELLSPGATLTPTVLWTETVGTVNNGIRDLDIDVDNADIYFMRDQQLIRVDYNNAGASTLDATPTLVSNFALHVVGPTDTTAAFGFEFDLDLAGGTAGFAYVIDDEFQNVFNPSPPPTIITSASENAIYQVDLATGVVTRLNFNPEDTVNPNLPDESFPEANGLLSDVVVDDRGTATFSDDRLIFTTISSNGGGAGVYAYNLNGNAAGNWTTLWSQPSSGSLSFSNSTIQEIEVNPSEGAYYITIQNVLNNGTTGIYKGLLAGGTPTLFRAINGTGSANGIEQSQATGITIDNQPTLALTLLGSTPTYTETAGSPSAAGTAIAIISATDTNDLDTTQFDDNLAGATVAITNNFVSGDRLTVNGDADGVGTLGSGISFSYNAANGLLTLSGVATFAEYEAALQLVQFTNAGDNPTDYGNKTNRTVSWAVTDGLVSSDVQNSTVNITAVNDAPINNSLPTLNGAGSVTEDTGKQITFSVSDVDADPANQNITVRLQVTHGTIDINTAVANGLTAGQVTGDNTNDVLLTGTQNQINLTLANATGAVYHNTPDYNGADTLTITTNDQGHTGTPSALTDVDNITININAVVDIANDTPTIAEDAGPTTIDVLANDTFENPGRAITAVGTASHGTVVINDNGTAGDATDDFVVYTSVADYNGADSFTYTVTSGGVTEQATVNVTVTAVADIVNDSVIVDEDSGANNLNLLANDTFENPSRAITAVGAALHGTTAINDNGTAGDATDDFVVYTPNANYNGSDSFTYTVTSPAGVTEQATVNVTVNPVNDPISTTAPATATLAEDSVNFAVTGLSIADIDATLAPAGVYEVTLAATQGVLTLTTLAGLTFTSGDGTTDTTMTFHGTLSSINTALATTKYSPNANYNGSAQITLQATDTFGGIVATGSGLATSDSDTINVTVTAVNDPVTGTAPANVSAAEDVLSVAVTGLSISDVDATLAPAGVYEVTLSASQGTLTLTTLTGLTFTGGSDGTADATMTFHGTLSDINTAVATATYAPNSNFNGSDTIVFSVTDTFGGIVATGTGLATSDSDNINVTVSAVNDSVTSNAPAGATVDEDVATPIAGLSISDVDATLAPAGVYEVTLAATNGTLTMTTLAGLTFTAGDGTDDATMTFHGTLSAINTALATASYTGASNFNGSAQISINVTDTFGGIVATGSGLATSDSDNISVTVSAANDPVTSNAPVNASGDEDAGPIAITGLSISDVDATLAPGGIYSVTLTATNGTLTLTTLTGLTFTGGSDGTADASMTFTGTLADINTALATASYTPAPNFAGAATVSISVTDDVGGTIATGSGLATSDSDNVNVTVNAVNDPPAATIDQASYPGSPGVSIDFKGELSVSDIDAAAGLVTVTLSVNSATAVLTVTEGGSGVLPANITGSGTNSVTITGTVAQIDALINTDGTSTVTFVDSAGGIKTLTLAIDDNGFTGSPGNLTAQDTAQIVLNQPPIITGDIAGDVTEAGGVANGTPGIPTATGNLDADDTDDPDDAWQPAAAGSTTTNGYGTYELTADGHWTYTLDDNNAAVQGLNGAGTLQDTFNAKTADGTTQVVTITIHAQNDAATVTGTASGNLVEAGGLANGTPGTPQATGNLLSTDVDNTTDAWQPVSAGATTVNGYGTYELTAAGVWTYTLDNNNAAVQALNTLTIPLSDSFTVLTEDGTAQIVTVIINGANDIPIITGPSTGDVTEAGGVANGTPGTPTATGNLDAADVDNPNDEWSPVAAGTTSFSGYGTYEVTADGHWTYTLDDTNAAVQALNGVATLTDTFNAATADGTTQLVTITIHAQNDAATISGTASGTVVEAGGVANGTPGTPTASGDLLSTEVDNTNDAWQPVSAGAATLNGYGTFELTADGVWTYTLDNNNAAVQALNTFTLPLSDSFTVLTEDGTAQIVNITINGANDTASITGTATGNVTEAGGVNNGTPGVPTATGNLDSTDIDNPNDEWSVVSGAASISGYGTYEVDAAGNWTYTLDDTNATVQALNGVATLTDTFNAATVDGTTQLVTVTIHAKNDSATITGTANGAVLEAGGIANGTVNTPTATGDLLSTDIDNTTDAWQAVAAGAATVNGYGTYGLTAAGVWTYTLDNTNATVQTVVTPISDQFTVFTQDGTAQLVTITINGADDAPALTGFGDASSFSENGSSVLLDNGNASVTDVELDVSPSNYQGATLTIARADLNDGVNEGPNPEDSFAATGTLDLVDVNGNGENVSLDGGATFIGTFVDNGDGSIQFTFNANATAADINSVMRQIVYANVSENPPTSVQVDYTFNDGNGQPGGQPQGVGPGVTVGSFTVHIAQSNDAPALLNVTPGAAYGIGTPGVILSPALSVFDPDAAPPSPLVGIANATIKIESGFFAGDELFVNLPSDGSGHFILDQGTPDEIVTTISVQSNVLGNLMLAATADPDLDKYSVATWQRVLDAVSYHSTAVDPSNGGLNPTRTISWVVNDGAANSQTPNLDPNNLVNATILHFDVPPAIDLDASGAGTGFTTAFTENGAAIAIVDTDVSITDPDNATVDFATIVLTNAKAGDSLSVAGALPIGMDSSIDTSVPGKITLRLSNSASLADYQTAIGQVRFANSGENPDTTDRDITVQVNGPGDISSNTAHATVHVVGVNDAPVNTVPGAQSTLPNTNKSIAGLAVSDIDANAGSLTTKLSVLHGILTVSSAGGAGVAGSGTASVTLTGTLAQINTTLAASNNIVYTSDPAFHGSDTLTVLTDDGGNTGTGGVQSDSDNVTILVSSPPTITSNGGGDTATTSMVERTTAVTTVTATDPDSSSLTFSIVGGSDSGKFQINATTGALSFVTAPNFDVATDADHNNSYIVQVRVSDGVQTDDQTLTVNVTDNPAITSTVHWVKSVDTGAHPAGWNPAGVGDFNGDGTADLAWFNPATGNLDIWKLTDGGWSGSSNVGSHPAGYQPVGFGDYNGDHTSDVLWYNPTTRDVDLWKISDGHWAGSVNIGVHPAGFQPSLSGDFNGDGTSDILWFNSATNAVDIWKIDSNGNWAGSVNVGTHPAGFQPALAGDFNGDGTSDVLWYNPTNGQVDIWNMSNGQWAGSVAVGAHPLGWQPLAAADFSFDGTADVAWHNPTTNNIEIWLIENSGWSQTANIGSHPPAAIERGGIVPLPPQSVPVVAVGAGDVDHNGVADIVWHNPVTGHIDNWLLDYS